PNYDLDVSKKFTSCCRGEKEHSGFNPLTAWHVICSFTDIGSAFGCRAKSGRGPDGARGNNAVGPTTAARHRDVVEPRAVAPHVEYRLSHSGLAVGGVASGHRLWAARCSANCSAWSSFLESRVGPPPRPDGPAHASDAEHAAYTSVSGGVGARSVGSLPAC